MSFDYGFDFLLNKRSVLEKLPPPDARCPYLRAFVSAEVKSFIMLTRSEFRYAHNEYPVSNARLVKDRGIAAVLEAGEWLHAADTDPELAASERREWRMNANVLLAYAEACFQESDTWLKYADGVIRV